MNEMLNYIFFYDIQIVACKTRKWLFFGIANKPLVPLPPAQSPPLVDGQTQAQPL